VTSFESVLKNAKTLVINRDSHGNYWVDSDFLPLLAQLETDSQAIVYLIHKFEVEKLRNQLQQKVNEMILGKPAVFRKETQYDKGYAKGYYDAKEQVKKFFGLRGG